MSQLQPFHFKSVLSELKKELTDTERELPYNELTRYLVHAGEAEGIPRAFGFDCIEQTRDLVERLREKTSASVNFLPVVRGPHQAVTVEEEGKIYLLDPYVLHREVIPLSKILEERRATAFPIFPIHPTVAQPTLVVHPTSRTEFRLELNDDPFAPNQPSEFYGFDLRRTKGSSTPMELRHLRRGKRLDITLRTLNPDDGVSSLFFDFEARCFTVKRIGGRRPRKYVENQYGDLFQAEFERIAAQLQVSPEQLRAYFHRAVTIQANLG